MIEKILKNLSTCYHSLQNDPLANDEILALFVPVAAYWIYSLFYHFLMIAQIPYFEQYRIHSPEDSDKRNRVGVKRVVSMVLLQQAIQILLGLLVLHPVNPELMLAQQEQTLGRMVSYAMNVLPLSNSDCHVHIALNIANALYWVVIPGIQFLAAM